MKPLERLAALKRLFLEAPDGWTTRDLADRLSESQRNIQRDLDALQAAPHYFPLVRDGWRWRLMDGHAYQLPPLTLTLHRLITLSFAVPLFLLPPRRSR